MSVYSRRNEILRIVNELENISTLELCEKLKVSQATIRRDLNQLGKNQLIKRTHGGASIGEIGINKEISKNIRFFTNISKKKIIADLALFFVKESDAIFLDSSSTTYYFAKELYKFKDLSIVSNGLKCLSLLSEISSFKVYTLAGIIESRENIVGPLAFSSIDNYLCNTVFFSCTAFSLEEGFTDATLENSLVKRRMIEKSNLKIALVDSDKFSKKYFSKIINIDEVDYIITDKKPSEDYIRVLKDKIIYPNNN